jgi:transcriptional regulator with XRE-family HTH domain
MSTRDQIALIKQLTTKTNSTAYNIAKNTNTSITTVSHILKGKNTNPKQETIKMILKYLNSINDPNQIPALLDKIIELALTIKQEHE